MPVLPAKYQITRTAEWKVPVVKVEGSYTFKAKREDVWNACLSPDILASCVPGVQKFEPTDEDTYEAVLKVGVAAITGTYTGKVALKDKNYPDSFKMVVEGKGSGGSIKGDALLTFTENNSETEVNLVGDVRVTGIVARVGQRLMSSTSKMLINQFFNCMRGKVEEG